MTVGLQAPASAYDTGSELQQGQNLTAWAAHVSDPPFPTPGLSEDPLHWLVLEHTASPHNNCSFAHNKFTVGSTRVQSSHYKIPRQAGIAQLVQWPGYMLDDPWSALEQGKWFFLSAKCPNQLLGPTRPIVNEYQHSFHGDSITEEASVKVQNKWSYNPLPLYAFTVQTRTSLALLIPLHEIYKTVKLCMHVYIKYVHVIILIVWQLTVRHHSIHSTSTCFIRAMNNICDRNNIELSKGGNGFITTRMLHVSINDDQLVVHSACWQVIPTSVLVVMNDFVVMNDNTACCFTTDTLCSTVHSVCPCLVLISSTDFGLFNAKPTYIHESNKNFQHSFLQIVSSFLNTVSHLIHTVQVDTILCLQLHTAQSQLFFHMLKVFI